MDISDYLHKLYVNPHNIIKTDLGLSNDIYTFELDKTKYCLRHSTNPAINKENLKLERKIQEYFIGKDFEFEEVYYDEKNGIRITKFIEDLKTFSKEDNNNKYKKIIEKIKQFHSIDIKTDIYFDLNAKYYTYLNKITNKLIDYSKYEYILKEYNSLNMKIVLSHNDLVDGNILYKNEKCYLTDYEFASLNYELFDLVSLLSENDLKDNQKEEIINLYFESNIRDTDLKNIKTIEKAQNLLWSTWSNMMYDINMSKIYLDIFNNKIKALKKI